jgi:hypothetical protein
MDTEVVSPVEVRLGQAWCLTHDAPTTTCHCRAAAPAHNWGKHNSLRKYLSVVASGKTHPFTRTGGKLIDFAEGAQAVRQALEKATVERVPLQSLIATNDVDREHVGKLLRGDQISARTGGQFESSEMPTVLRVGDRHLVLDGHHRCTEAYCKGETHDKMRVVSGLTPRFQNSPDLLVRP